MDWESAMIEDGTCYNSVPLNKLFVGNTEMRKLKPLKSRRVPRRFDVSKLSIPDIANSLNWKQKTLMNYITDLLTSLIRQPKKSLDSIKQEYNWFIP